MNIHKKAFTLTEVLITLGIIGVVAALTIPTLIGRYKEKETTARLKKVYSTLSQAYVMATENYGAIENWAPTAKKDDPDGADIYMEKFAEFTKNIKTCKSRISGCLPNVNYKWLNGKKYYNYDNQGIFSRIKLDDGSIIFFQIANGSCVSYCADIYVDINGNKLPNQFGTDAFVFYLTKNGITPYGHASNVGLFSFKQDCHMKGYGWGCAAWVIYNENMDYLHCDDLSWDGKHKCSDK